MEIRVAFDEELLREYQRRGSAPLISIWLTHGGESYPGSGWTDFAAIVGWWMTAVRGLLTTDTSCELLFMDGPYSMDVRREDDQAVLRMRGAAGEWRMPVNELAKDILRAGEQVHGALIAAGIRGTEVRAIGKVARALKAALELGRKDRD